MHSRKPLEHVDSDMMGRNLKVGRSRSQSEQAKLEKSFRDGWRKFEQHWGKGESAGFWTIVLWQRLIRLWETEGDSNRLSQTGPSSRKEGRVGETTVSV